MNNINQEIASFLPSQALLEQKLKEKANREESIPQRTNRDAAPLSFSQQRMWLLDQLLPGNPVYNRPTNIRLTGQLDLAVLEQSLNEIVRRHEILRTSFSIVDGQQPVQAIAETVSLKLNVIDLGDRVPNKQEAEVQQLAATVAQSPFDLAQTPLLRATLLRLSEREHILLLTLHHIIFDDLSMGVLLKELAALYEAFSAGQPSPLPELPIQYADYAIWQRQWLQGEILLKQLAYWKQQLADIPAVLELPTDYPRGAIQTFNGSRQVIVLPQPLTVAIISLSQKQGVTLYMTLLAAFQTLLYRYTSQSDIVVGSPIAGRNRSEIESLIGLFVNTLVLRTSFDDNPTFEELLSQVREMTLGAYAHQDLPFEKLVEQLQPSRNLSHSPLFQVMFVLQNTAVLDWELAGLSIHSINLDTCTAKFDITLEITETERGLMGEWEYNTEKFSAETIKRMAGHFQTLLEAIVANPSQKVASLPLLTAAEHHQLLGEWNNTKVEYPQEKCIHQLFEAQVERTPDAVAVVFEERQLTYRQLNEAANQLAHYLQNLGVKPEVLVGICVERSVEMVVGLLGILKAGGAYVPLDPKYPKERLAFMLEDAQTSVLLTQSGLVESLPFNGARVVCLDTDWQAIVQHSRENPQSLVTPVNLAYVIYTSGSTGRPKGVCMSHSPLVNLLCWQIQHSSITSGAKTLQFAPISFDVSFQEIFSTWCSGGELVLISEAIRREPVELLRLLAARGVERLFLPVVALQQLAETADAQKLFTRSLVEVIVAGEQLLITQHLANWFSQLPGCLLHNHYGPSETHVVTAFTLTGKPETWQVMPPIGCPIANTQIYILSRDLKVVPIGVPGELYIAGCGMARGYLNQPQLTAAKFIPNPFQQGKCLYKTGDLARYLGNGNIEFLGRLDDQVKIRGFRIELGEIEAVLSQHPQVLEAIVIARVDNGQDKRLVAYVRVQQQQKLTASQLRCFLKEKLPSYMIPSAFVLLDKLPLTPNGKIDRRALPAPELQRTVDETKVAPRTPVEEILAGIWAEVLHLEGVGIHDNFFELGGHSLLATQVISRIRQSFEVELPLRSLFESPTLAELGQHIKNHRLAEPNHQIPPLLPTSRESNIPLSFAQARLWFLEQLEPNSAVYNIPKVLQLKGILNIEALQQGLDFIVARHQALRTNFVTVDGTAVQVIGSNYSVELPIIDLAQLPQPEKETQVQRLLEQQVQRPFNLCQDLMLRSCLLRLSCSEHVLVLVMHHIASDGWSIGILIKELAALYQAFSTGKSSPLPELPIQYADYAIWQRQWLQGEILLKQLAYWKEQLADIPAVLELPTDYPRGAIQTFNGSRQVIVLPQPLTVAIISLSQKQGVTLYMTLLAAFQTLLYRYTSQSDIVVGSPIAGRNRSEIESLIGLFVNTLVLRTSFHDNPRFEELLSQVREMTLGAYAHQDLPFEKLVEQLQPSRNLSHSPLFQVMFVLQNTTVLDWELAGLSIHSINIDTGTAKFDITLEITETEQGLMGEWEYNTEKFSAETIKRMAGHFQTLLEAIVANPSQKVASLPLLTAAEHHQLLVEWNNTKVEYPQEKCIHQLFEAQVERTPDAVAVVFEERQITYRQLNSSANQLAHYLQNLGVKPEVLVGICVERSLEMVVGMLGILKAGGAYVPIDPAYPQERIDYMLQDSQAPVLLTQQSLKLQLAEQKIQGVYLDTDREVIAREHGDNLSQTVTSSNLAYAIYTSGSTGKPKGVQIEHRNVINLFNSISKQLDLTSQDILLSVTTICFDIAVVDIFLPLSLGASLVVVSREVAKDGTQLSMALNQCPVTIMQATPVTWQLLLAAGWQGSARLKIISTGEALPRQLAYQLLDKGTGLWNLYGPTEITIWASIYRLESGESSILIGRPLANTRFYILDSHLQPVPIGVAGELYIGGEGLARGYLNRPELTAEKFISNPFSSRPYALLYKTGDLARYRANGDVEYLGRIDNQVKLRGNRIELGEIEAVLSQHPQVLEAIVIARVDNGQDKRLVAYARAKGDRQLTASQLRCFLKEKLPSYMIPSAFVLLDKLPLTPNGKIDRRALPAPDSNSEEPQETFVAPRDELERQLTLIWEKVLGREPIGVRDDFFALGGHSLLAIRLVAAIEETFKKKLPLAALFRLTTVSQLASILRQSEASAPVSATEQQLTASPSSDSPQLSPEDYRALLAIVAGRKGERPRPHSLMVGINSNGLKPPLFFCANGFDEVVALAQHMGESQPFYFLESGLSVKNQDRNSYIKAVAAHHVNDILALQPEGAYLVGGYSYGSLVAFEIAQQLRARGKQMSLLAIIDTYGPDKDYHNYTKLEWRYLYNLSQFSSINSYQSKVEFIVNKLKRVLQKTSLSSLTTKEPDLLSARSSVSTTDREYIIQAYEGRMTLFLCSDILPYKKLGVFLFPRCGWSKSIINELEVHWVPGNHLSMIREPFVGVLAEKLKACIERASHD